MVSNQIVWQVLYDDGREELRSPDTKLPENFKEIRLMNNGRIRVRFCSNGLDYFRRNFGDLTTSWMIKETEYHIRYGDVDISYSPTTDEVTICCGETKY